MIPFLTCLVIFSLWVYQLCLHKRIIYERDCEIFHLRKANEGWQEADQKRREAEERSNKVREFTHPTISKNSGDFRQADRAKVAWAYHRTTQMTHPKEFASRGENVG